MKAHAPPLDGSGPIWLQIRRALARSINGGDWAPGTRVPSELELTRHYGASRMTVHKAIQSLASKGLVERRRKLGTVVSERAQERPVLEIWDIATEAKRLGGHYNFRVVERAVMSGREYSDELPGIYGDTPLLRIVCQHRSDDTVLQLEERLINVDAAPGVLREKFIRTSPNRWLIRHVPWTQAEHTILARTARGRIAELLDVKPGTACLVVERRTWNGATPVTFARLLHPGERHRLVGRFEP